MHLLNLGFTTLWIVAVPWLFAVVLFPVSALPVCILKAPKSHAVCTFFQADNLGHDVQGILSGFLYNMTSVKAVLHPVSPMITA